MRRIVIAAAAALTLTAGLLTAAPAYAVTAPAWEVPAHRLSSGQKNAETSAVVVDGKGNTTAVYWKGTSSTGVIMATRANAANVWSTPQSISGAFSTRYVADTSPALAVEASGRVTAAWDMVDAKTGSIYVEVARMRPNGKWSAPVVVSRAGTISFGPQLGVDPHDDIFVAWTAIASNGNSVIQGVEKQAQMGWGRVKTLSDTTHSSADPHVAVLAGGECAVVWRTDYSKTYSAIEAKVGDNDCTSFGGTRQVSTTNLDSGSPSVAAVGSDYLSGSFELAWSQKDPNTGNYIINVSNRPVLNNTWSTPTPVSPQGNDAVASQLAVDKAGDIGVVWQWGDTTNTSNPLYQIQVSTLTAGSTTWTTENTLSNTSYDAEQPRIAADAQGDFAVAWSGNDGTDYRIWAQVWQLGGATYQAVTALSAAGQSAGDPALTSSPAGNIALLWSRYNGSYDRVQESRFDLAPPVSRTIVPKPTLLTTTGFTVGWSAIDWTGVSGYSLRVNDAPWNGTFAGNQPWTPSTTGKTATYAGRPGHTYCFSAQATDTHGFGGLWSRHQCVTTPVDDVTGKAVGTWVRAKVRGSYRRTLSVSSTKGSKLVFPGVQAKNLAILVETAKGGGSFRVYFNGNDYGTVQTAAASVEKKKILRVFTALDADTTGKLVIKVLGTGKVRIDGIYAIK